MQRRREEDKKNRRSCNYSWVKEKKKTVEMKNTVEAREGEPQFKSVFFVGVRREKID